MPRCVRLLLACLSGFLAAHAAATTPGQRAYLWQRAWTTEFQQGVATHGADFAALDVLVAEITWPAGAPAVHRVTPTWEVLRATGRPVGLVVRIGPRAGSWNEGDPATQAVIATGRAVLAEARAAGIEPVELQLDFDAATARLAAYQTLLQTVRREVQPPRLTITTLPDWLRSADFSTLVRATDAYVLQVHSLEKPRSFEAAYTLCDPVRAAAWIRQASALGHPFRVALPAYGYRLIFDGTGKFVALEAEAPAAARAEGSRARIVTAEPALLAKFVAEFLATPPAACEGLVWFRFPNATDELAWSWPTLRAVRQGRAPEARLALRTQPNPAGTLDLVIANEGETTEPPTAFRITWRAARLLAADALAGWQLAREGPGAVVLHPPPHGSNGRLRPGDTLDAGWLRFDRAVELQVTALP